MGVPPVYILDSHMFDGVSVWTGLNHIDLDNENDATSISHVPDTIMM